MSSLAEPLHPKAWPERASSTAHMSFTGLTRLAFVA